MDRIVAGFMAKVGDCVRLRTQVETVRLTDTGVDVVFRHEGERTLLQADYCLNSIPMPLIASIDHDVPPEYADGFTAIQRGR